MNTRAGIGRMTEMTLLLHDEDFSVVHFVEEKDEVEHFGTTTPLFVFICSRPVRSDAIFRRQVC
jgi:hypothetical protein